MAYVVILKRSDEHRSFFAESVEAVVDAVCEAEIAGYEVHRIVDPDGEVADFDALLTGNLEQSIRT